jgi:hypothetical protein
LVVAESLDDPFCGEAVAFTDIDATQRNAFKGLKKSAYEELKIC